MLPLISVVSPTFMLLSRGLSRAKLPRLFTSSISKRLARAIWLISREALNQSNASSLLVTTSALESNRGKEELLEVGLEVPLRGLGEAPIDVDSGRGDADLDVLRLEALEFKRVQSRRSTECTIATDGQTTGAQRERDSSLSMALRPGSIMSEREQDLDKLRKTCLTGSRVSCIPTLSVKQLSP